MNNFCFNDLFLGQQESFEITLNENNLFDFSKLSGDKSLIHTDSLYALNNGFKGKVVHGAFIISLYSRLLGMQLPGKNCLLLELQTKFKNPAYLNSQIKISGEIVSLHPSVSCIDVKLKSQYFSGKVISTCKALVKLLK